MSGCSTRGRSTRGRGLVQERSSQVVCRCAQKTQNHVYNMWEKLAVCQEVLKRFMLLPCPLRSVALYEYPARGVSKGHGNLRADTKYRMPENHISLFLC